MTGIAPGGASWVLPPQLVELAEFGGPEMVVEILQIFLEDTPKRMAELRAAVESGSAERIRREAHGLKGGCAQIGAHPLAMLAATLEADHHPELRRKLVESAEAEYRLVEALIRAHPYFHS